MTSEHILRLLAEGEGLNVEFKKCLTELNNSVYETVCSFSNRYGGHILFGIDDNGGIIGVNPSSALSMKKNFINMLNNPQKISPPLLLEVEKLPDSAVEKLPDNAAGKLPNSAVEKLPDSAVNKLPDSAVGMLLNNVAGKLPDSAVNELTYAEKVFLIRLMPLFDGCIWITNAQAREATGKSDGSVKRFMRNLTNKGILENRGVTKNRQYRLP